MENLTIVTFISGDEKLNTSLLDLFSQLNEIINNIRLIIYSDNNLNTQIKDNRIEIKLTLGITKYKRILMSFYDTNTDNILYIDNDITPNISNLKLFISKIDKKVDLAWGLIDALPGHNFLYKLVKIDKFISHIIIRPLLWKFNICISLPGQIFFINKSKFLRDLPIYDTLFDDLTIGIVAKKNKYLSNYFKLYLGYEKPSTSFYLLLKQRLRWSKGFYQAIINNLHNGMLIYILIHGFMYHFLWAPLLILFIIFFKISSIVALFSLILLCLFLSNMKSYLFIYSISYCFIFPIIHLVWFFSLLKYIIFKKNK